MPKKKTKSQFHKGFGKLPKADPNAERYQKAIDALFKSASGFAKSDPSRSAVYLPVQDAALGVASLLILADSIPKDRRMYRESASFWMSLILISIPEMLEPIKEIERVFGFDRSATERATEMIRVSRELQNAMRQEQERQIESIENEIDTEPEIEPETDLEP
jgi:hypothetical protein